MLVFKYRGSIKRGAQLTLTEHCQEDFCPSRIEFDPPEARHWLRLRYGFSGNDNTFPVAFGEEPTRSIEEAEATMPWPNIPQGMHSILAFLICDDAPEADDVQLTIRLT